MTNNIPETFKALRISDDEDGYRAEIVEQSIDEQSDGDVVVRVSWSSVNYKDALAGTGKGKILRKFPAQRRDRHGRHGGDEPVWSIQGRR